MLEIRQIDESGGRSSARIIGEARAVKTANRGASFIFQPACDGPHYEATEREAAADPAG